MTRYYVGMMQRLPGQSLEARRGQKPDWWREVTAEEYRSYRWVNGDESLRVPADYKTKKVEQ